MVARLHTLRRLAEKARRRLRQIVGRPDTTPWPIFPPRRRGGGAYIDFVFALDYLSPNSRLVRLFSEAMGRLGLSLLLVNQSNVKQIRRQVESGWLRPHVYLDLSSRPGDDFEQLLYAAARCGVHTIRKPEHTCWIMKAEAHVAIEKAGLPVPPSVIIRKDEPDRDLTEAERQRLGEHCVIKPSWGESGSGVVVDVPGTMAQIAAARNFKRHDDWLVQKMVRWASFDGRPAYLRAYNICGHRSMVWWSREDGREGYRVLTWDDARRYDLLPAADLVERLADLSGMDFFSVEVAVTGESGPGRFMLIDYLNDQCDMNPEGSAVSSPPEVWCQWVCGRFADFTFRRKHNIPPDPRGSIFLPSIPAT